MEKGTVKNCKICGKYTVNASELCPEHEYREGNCWVYDMETDRWGQKFRDVARARVSNTKEIQIIK